MTVTRYQDMDLHSRCANELHPNDLHQHGRTIVAKTIAGATTAIWYHSTPLGFTQIKISTGKGVKKRN